VERFTVTAIIDGDTFEVSPNWKWQGHTGNRIRPAGYDAPEVGQFGGASATDKLARLILHKQVELGTAHRVDRGRLVCEVFFQGRNLAHFFRQYR